MNIIFGSGGNDSVALVQWAIEKGLKDLHVAYSNTGWAADFWAERLDKFRALVESNGGTYHEIQSEGMVNLSDLFQLPIAQEQPNHFHHYQKLCSFFNLLFSY